MWSRMTLPSSGPWRQTRLGRSSASAWPSKGSFLRSAMLCKIAHALMMIDTFSGLILISEWSRWNLLHLFWFLMVVILFLSCRNLPRPENQSTILNPPTISKLLQFYLMSKVCPNSFAVPYNNKAYALFSSRRLR